MKDRTQRVGRTSRGSRSTGCHCRPRAGSPTRGRFRTLTNLGLTDAVRAGSDSPELYTFWDYQAGAWQKNWGLRIDHLLLSPQASDRLTNVGVDSYVRAWEKPSDHVPVWADFDLETA